MRSLLLCVLVLFTIGLSSCTPDDAETPSDHAPTSQRLNSAIFRASDPYHDKELQSWLKRAADRIDSLRKSNIQIRVVDASDQPVAGAKVHLRMKRHHFTFGTAVSAQLLTDTTADGERYRQAVKRLFNKVVLENDLKWGPWLAHTPRYNQFQTLRALYWLKDQGIPVRGHYLAWGYTKESDPVRFRPEAPDTYRNAIFEHIREKINVIDGLVAEWDVINHIVTRRNHNLAEVYGKNIWVELLQLAHSLAPAQRRFVNEGRILIHHRNNRRDAYRQAIQYLIEHDAPLDGIGMMGHFNASTLTPPDDLWRIFDQFAVFGLPILITEFDVRFGNMGERYVLTPEEEQLQAAYTRAFLTAAFSHPAVEGILLWGFWEGRHWYPSAALYQLDWSPKPNGQVWEELTLHAWWTDTTGITDETGRFLTRGFKGAYELDVRHEDKYLHKEFVVQDSSISLDIHAR
ncbi:MAG: hypothetical protein D6746_12135 [Bacteroidetes bacterium]|nr:MAG: hypothetical protein D6746_12135 [Bacteroidota bacterium]